MRCALSRIGRPLTWAKSER